MAMPIVIMLGLAVLVAGMAGVEATAVHAAAREAARAAAAGEDIRARLSAVGLSDVAVARVEPSPDVAEPGEPITVEIAAPSRALGLLGADVELRVSATAAREPRPAGAAASARAAPAPTRVDAGPRSRSEPGVSG